MVDSERPKPSGAQKPGASPSFEHFDALSEGTAYSAGAPGAAGAARRAIRCSAIQRQTT
jgi:hypothetical protein